MAGLYDGFVNLGIDSLNNSLPRAMHEDAISSGSKYSAKGKIAESIAIYLI